MGKENNTIINIIECARCGENHIELEFFKFNKKPTKFNYTHWALCPSTGEPILNTITVEKSENQLIMECIEDLQKKRVMFYWKSGKFDKWGYPISNWDTIGTDGKYYEPWNFKFYDGGDNWKSYYKELQEKGVKFEFYDSDGWKSTIGKKCKFLFSKDRYRIKLPDPKWHDLIGKEFCKYCEHDAKEICINKIVKDGIDFVNKLNGKGENNLEIGLTACIHNSKIIIILPDNDRLIIEPRQQLVRNYLGNKNRYSLGSNIIG